MIQEVKRIYLCTPNLKIRTMLNGVRTESVDLRQHIKDYDELTFTVDRYLFVDGEHVESNGYEDLKVYMYLYLEDIGYFQIQEPSVENDGIKEQKTIQAYSIEKEFEQKDWIGLKINTGEPDSLEMLVDGNVDPLSERSYKFITLVNEENHALSFLHIMLTKLPNWSIGHIDDELKEYKIPMMTIENGNIYSIMTTNVAPRLSMIFYFDHLHRTVNAYHRDNLDFDTSIFIGFRNLANQVNIEVDEDSVFTRFRVRGEEDLDFTNANFGSDQCIDLSYFLCEPYMHKELADKVKLWMRMMDENRPEYIQYEKEAAEHNAKIDSLEYRVPSDETYWRQWDNMNEDGLNENLRIFNLQLTALRLSVDTRSDSQKYDSQGNYIPYKKSNGQIDNDLYLSRLQNSENGYGGYYTYLEIQKYVIPYIQTAINNLYRPSDQKIKYGTESEEDWSLYGYNELDGKRRSYEEDILPSLANFSKPWSQLTDEEKLNYVNEDGYNKQGRSMYLHIQQMLGNENTAGTIYYYLKKLKDEIDREKGALSVVQRMINLYAGWAQFETAVDTRGDRLFTDDEVKYLSNLLIDTDYVNSNIFAVSTDTAVTKIDRELELYEDAMQKLSEVSRPQYEFRVELDNLIRIPEFEGWVEDLRLMRFIRLGVREDYIVKLRIIEIEYNPCEIDSNLVLTFSSMITSRSGRNDLTQIIDDENHRGAKNAISIGLGNANQANEYIETLLTMMTKNGLFTQAVRNVASGVTGQISTTAVNNAINSYMSNTTYPISHVTGTSSEFEDLFSRGFTAESISNILLNAQSGRFDQVITKYLQSDTVVTKLLQADEADFGTVTAKFMNTGYLNATHIIGVEDGDFQHLWSNMYEGSKANIDEIISRLVKATEIDVEQITGNYANFAKLISPYISAGTVDADAVITALLQADQADVQKLSAQNAFIDYLNSNLVVASEIRVDDLTAKLATIDVADVNKLSADSAFIKGLQTINSISIQNVVDTEFVKTLIAGKISVGDLAAGNIVLTDTMKIVSENGMMTMDGTALQMIGEDSQGNPYVGIQLGYDSNSNPSLIIRNEQGATILTPEGITANAIANELIRNDMIKTGTITEEKLGFNVMKTGDEISIEQIYTGDGKFGAEWANFKSNTQEAINEIKADIEESANYDLYIETPNGTNIWGGNITLNVRLLKNNIDVTDEYDPSCFIWTRASDDSYGDIYWNDLHSTGEKVITITASDVKVSANFQCKFEYEDIVIVAN